MSNGGLTLFRRLIIDPIILEYLNIRYAEKQVKGIDENFFYYDLGVRLPNVIPGNPPPSGRNYLTEKIFSGDVSGDIGESTFVYFLTEELSIDGTKIGHLRPEKIKKHLTPDFVVWEQNTTISAFLQSSYVLPLYAEVKSSTGMIGVKRIKDGLSQLQMVMPSGSHGLLFLLQKSRNSVYEAFLIGVKS